MLVTDMRSLLTLCAFILCLAGIALASPVQSCSTPQNPYPWDTPNPYTQTRIPCTLDTPAIGAITIWFDIDNSSGPFKLSFNPDSPTSQSASAQANFAGGFYQLVGSPTIIGHVSGVMPTLIFDNGTNANNYFQDDLYGFGATTLWFAFYGPALSAPDGSPGTTFAFSLPGYFDPVLTIHVNGDGSTTATDYVSGTELGFFPGVYPPVSSVPEPTSLALMLLPLLAIAGGYLRRVVSRYEPESSPSSSVAPAQIPPPQKL